MKKSLILHFIPHIENNHRPFALRHKALLFYALFLLLLQIGLAFTPLKNQKAIASSFTAGDIIRLTNSARSSSGITPLRVDGALNLAAKKKAVHMLTYNYWAHTSKDGITPWYFISKAGYNYLYAGENLARDFVAASSVVNAWKASPAHRDNLFSRQYQDMGVAVVKGELLGKQTILVVQMFGRKVQSSQSSYFGPAAKNGSLDITPPEPPKILKPENQSVTNDLRLEISGSAEASTEIGVFDGEEKLGSLPADDQGSFTYKTEKDLSEGNHLFSADATDASGNTSQKSIVVNVKIDTIPVKIMRNSLKISSQNSNLGTEYFVSIKAEEKAEAVLLSISDYSVLLDPIDCQVNIASSFKALAKTKSPKSCFIYTTSFVPPQKSIQEARAMVSITSFDKAGNTDEYRTKLPVGVSLAATNLINNSFLKRFFENPQSALINMFFALSLVALFIVDSLMIFRRGVVRQNSHSSAHFLIILTAILAMLFLQNGNII